MQCFTRQKATLVLSKPLAGLSSGISRQHLVRRAVSANREKRRVRRPHSKPCLNGNAHGCFQPIADWRIEQIAILDFSEAVPVITRGEKLLRGLRHARHSAREMTRTNHPAGTRHTFPEGHLTSTYRFMKLCFLNRIGHSQCNFLRLLPLFWPHP